MPEITFQHVSKYFGSSPALDDVTLAFRRHTTTAIVGPSGSGKSTLLQMINGLLRPDSGGVSVFGKSIDYRDLPRLRLQIGYAVQDTGLFPHMRAWDNITILSRLVGWAHQRSEERANRLMELVGLPKELGQRYPHELSGGQQQRVGLCRAMMLNPKIFLLDEPFGALDPITRSELQNEFLRLQSSEPRTIVLVTHDIREALKLSEWIVVLNDGVVVQEGEGRDIVRSPATPFVRELFETQLGPSGSSS